MFRKAIEEHCFEKRFVNLDASVVMNEPESAKAVHEEASARTSSADHLRLLQHPDDLLHAESLLLHQQNPPPSSGSVLAED